MMNSPHDWGMWRSSKEDPCQEEAGWPLGKMIVVVVVVVVVFVVVFAFLLVFLIPGRNRDSHRLIFLNFLLRVKEFADSDCRFGFCMGNCI